MYIRILLLFLRYVHSTSGAAHDALLEFSKVWDSTMTNYGYRPGLHVDALASCAVLAAMVAAALLMRMGL